MPQTWWMFLSRQKYVFEQMEISDMLELNKEKEQGQGTDLT